MPKKAPDADRDKDGTPGFDDIGDEPVADVEEDLKDDEDALK